MAVQALLSPEKYIRTKARNLPVYECIVNENWKKEGMAMIYIGRRHNNGNITFGSYVVDLLCMGVKDTGYDFNVDINEWDEIKSSIKNEGLTVDFIDYNLAHNIIFGGIAFAEEYGFKPHKDFSLTQFILEEDDDRIPLIDIEFGHQGKPHIIVHKEDSKAKVALNYLKAHFTDDDYFYTMEVAKSLLEDDDDNWETNLDDDDKIENEIEEKLATLKATILPIKDDIEALYTKHFASQPQYLSNVDFDKLPFKTGRVPLANYEPAAENLIRHFVNDDYEDAEKFIAEIKQAAEKYPHIPSFWLLAADIYHENDRTDEGINLLREKSKEFPTEFIFIVREMSFLSSLEKRNETISLGTTYYPILSEFAVNGLLDKDELIDYFNILAFALRQKNFIEDAEICMHWLKKLDTPAAILDTHEISLVLYKYGKLSDTGVINQIQNNNLFPFIDPTT